MTSHQLYVEECGDPGTVLKLRRYELPETLGPTDVAVQMLMAPVNPADLNMIEGTYSVQPPLPAVMGNEGVGKVVEVGADVQGVQAGDLVIPADAGFGTWQTFKISKDKDVIKLPGDVPLISAATISANPCTAYRMIKDFVDLKPGDVIIQNGANSGVGVSVIQLAKEWKFKTINTVRNRPDFDKLTDYLLSLGADAVVTEEFVRSPQMKELLKTFPTTPKLAFNCVGGQSATDLLRHLCPKGVMVTYGGMSKLPVSVPSRAFIFSDVVLCGYWNTNWNRIHKTDIARYEMLSDLSRLIKESKFKPPLCEFFKLEDYKAAIEKATEGFKGVKAVFDMQ
ncbi:enoyl-[acyl-carrier-protein] reductase, mitochondrial-like [Physella acuta]|uniref:enoyl-[acyl-carrier-protein] reductase, mitochondrial-like n=1 Tax=Physella acuta TaxID=109671 RepID=UPI0027DCE8B6|nr:enoyl-[acyl-carrier-protein] reductase, mitochondrial-like [Physella acuta]